MPIIDPALTVALAHETRRRQPLPPLTDLPIADDDAIALVRAEELRRSLDRLGWAIDRARSA
jgi:hypothetical protein